MGVFGFSLLAAAAAAAAGGGRAEVGRARQGRNEIRRPNLRAARRSEPPSPIIWIGPPTACSTEPERETKNTRAGAGPIHTLFSSTAWPQFTLAVLTFGPGRARHMFYLARASSPPPPPPPPDFGTMFEGRGRRRSSAGCSKATGNHTMFEGRGRRRSSAGCSKATGNHDAPLDVWKATRRAEKI
jgi:hypothetical protein